jgi:hypothetical protein
MKTANVIEAMEAAKTGLRVRLVRDRMRDEWLVLRGIVLAYDGGSAFHLNATHTGYDWEIEEIRTTPHRDVVSAAEHMEATGNWGRPVADEGEPGGPWLTVTADEAGCFRYATHPHRAWLAWHAEIVGPWETKPAETV